MDLDIRSTNTHGIGYAIWYYYCGFFDGYKSITESTFKGQHLRASIAILCQHLVFLCLLVPLTNVLYINQVKICIVPMYQMQF